MPGLPPLQPRSARFYACPPQWQVRERTRPTHQLWLVTGGATDVVAGEGLRVHLRPRSVLLVWAGSPHALSHEPSDPLRCHVVHFTGSLGADDTAGGSGLVYGQDLSASGVPAQWWRVLAEEVEVLETELEATDAAGGILAQSALLRLLGTVDRVAADARVAVGRGAGPRAWPPTVRRVVDHVHAHYAEPLTVRRMCEIAAVSEAHLNRLFGAAVGMPPLRYVRRVRLDAARQLLSETDLPVGVVARRAGFDDPLYFSRAFRRAEGCTPSTYRSTARRHGLP